MKLRLRAFTLIDKIVIFMMVLFLLLHSSAAGAIECLSASGRVLSFDTQSCPFGLAPKNLAPVPPSETPRQVSRPSTSAVPPSAPPKAASQPRPPAKANVGEASQSSTEIPLLKEGGTFKVPVLINGIIPLHFTVDSGASDVTIPADVVMTLMRTGTIVDDDFLGDQIYVLADGSRIKSKRFRIRQLKVGDSVVHNVVGSVADVRGSLLLGQSFLSRFRKVSFNYKDNTLILE